jgi:hypothetical protein
MCLFSYQYHTELSTTTLWCNFKAENMMSLASFFLLNCFGCWRTHVFIRLLGVFFLFLRIKLLDSTEFLYNLGVWYFNNFNSSVPTYGMFPFLFLIQSLINIFSFQQIKFSYPWMKLLLNSSFLFYTIAYDPVVLISFTRLLLKY